MIIPNIQKQRIIQFLKEGKRFDGRKPEDYREMEIRTGVSNKAEGSASVKFGKTEVYAGVKMSVATPYADGPNEGTLAVAAELGPMASPDFDIGPPSIQAIEVGRIIDRGIRESGIIDWEKLCITPGEKVWSISLDLYAVNDAGNLLDVAALAALVALADAKMPVYDKEKNKIEHEWTKNSLPLNKDAMSFNITFHKIGNQIVLDPVREEEEIADYRLSIAIANNEGKPRITAMQKGKEGAISTEEMDKILNLLEVKFAELFPKIEKFVWKK